jgi:hypothetical protein
MWKQQKCQRFSINTFFRLCYFHQLLRKCVHIKEICEHVTRFGYI